MNKLNYSSIATERDLRLAIVECGRICYERGLMTANDGNISARMDHNLVVITPSGLCKGRLEAEDLLVLDLDSNILKSHRKRKLTTSSETPMHLEVYRQREEVRGVIHAHPSNATALTMAGLPFPVDVHPEILITLGDIPVTEYATPSTGEDAGAIREMIKEHDALLLKQHGSLTVGKDLDAALINLERIEKVAEMFVIANSLGKVNRLSRDAVKHLIELRKQYKSD